MHMSKATSEAIWDWNIQTGHIYFNTALHDLVGTDLDQVFRIIQEQTKNIIKYSNAKTVEISLHCCIDQVRLEICDDGRDFDSQNTRRGLGYGTV
jgi:signal transduction histidine kinase